VLGMFGVFEGFGRRGVGHAVVLAYVQRLFRILTFAAQSSWNWPMRGQAEGLHL
jgi:hypothetical protein